MNTRAKGRKFEKLEEAAWRAFGWETELVRPEARFIGPGKAVVAYRDFFNRYDLIAAWPKASTVVFIQVSTEPVSSHKDPGPLGFPPLLLGAAIRTCPVEVLLTAPKGTTKPLLYSGVYEVYTRWVKLKRTYVPVRGWWVKHDH